MSAERDEMDERHERSEALWEWLRLLRKTAPKETQIDLIRSRFDNATDADERRDLKDHLQILLHQTDRIDEALQLGDAWIAENPNDVFAYTASRGPTSGSTISTTRSPVSSLHWYARAVAACLA